MKRPYFSLWTLLATALLIMVFFASFGKLKMCGRQISTIEISTKKNDITHNVKVADNSVITIDTLPKRILFVGDSMLEGLSPRFASYAASNGHKLYTVVWYGSTTLKWGETHRLAQYKKQFEAEYIVVCLGGNELFIKNVEKERGPMIDEILQDIGDTPYVWIGPPNWKEDTGINTLIESKVGEGHFFLSKNLELARAKDGAHPTRAAAIGWMDIVAEWISTKSACRIRLEKPVERTAKADKLVVLTPDD